MSVRSADLALTRRVVRQARPFWAGITGVFLLDLLLTPLMLLTPLPLAIAVDSVLGDTPLPGWLAGAMPDALTSSDHRVLLLAALLSLGVVLLSQAQEIAVQLLRTRTSEGLTLAFRARLFAHAQRLSLGFHDSRGTSDSVYRIQYDTASVSTLSIDGLLPLLSAAITLTAMLVVVANIDLQLLAVALLVCPPLFLLSRSYKRRARRWYREAKILESSALGVVQEVLGALRVVKAFGREDSEHDRFVERSRSGMRARVHLAVAESAFTMLINLTTATGAAAVLYVGVRSVQSGDLTLGQLLLVLSYLGQLYGPLKTMSRKIGSIQSSLASAERAFEVLDELPDVPEPEHPRPLENVFGTIEFEDVSFAYDGGTEVLSGITFRIAAGTRLGIAGRTGAGKSTLVSLICRFYDPTSGRILLDGQDLRDSRVSDVRSQFAIVLQEPVLFSSSIAENIAYASPGGSFDDVVAAARAANAHEFITALPQGYDTLVGERGLRLSGGERQRISLARAFLRDAPVLILDEPTSSVDMHTESEIMEAMERLMLGRTTIMIAHRLSTLDICDARIEVAAGRIAVASGAITCPSAGVLDLTRSRPAKRLPASRPRRPARATQP